MDINDLRSIFTVLVIVMFAGIVGWAYSSKRKDSFDAAAKLALDDEDVSLRGGKAGQQHN
jgi:cytochrome c oxidase cbb3-type subunit IV